MENKLDLAGSLASFLQRQASRLGEERHLRYSSDLAPDACERSIWYRLHGGAKDPPKLGDELRFHGGRIFERTLLDALRASGEEVLTQVPVRPLRPSAWAMATGHADIVVVRRRRLLEVKAPRSAAFEWAGQDGRGLVRGGYPMQLSAYFLQLKDEGLVDSAGWVFLDREGSHAPVEVELDGDLLVPLPKIIELEAARSRLVLKDAPRPERLPREVTVSALKGRGANGRTLSANAKLNWRCSYCSFSKACNPGPADALYDLTPAEHAKALEEAEKRWASGEQRVTVKLGTTPNDDETDAEGDPLPKAAPKTAPRTPKKTEAPAAPVQAQAPGPIPVASLGPDPMPAPEEGYPW